MHDPKFGFVRVFSPGDLCRQVISPKYGDLGLVLHFSWKDSMAGLSPHCWGLVGDYYLILGDWREGSETGFQQAWHFRHRQIVWFRDSWWRSLEIVA